MFQELLSSSNLLNLPVIAMFMFMAVFAGVIVFVFRRSRRAKYRHISMLPLDDEDRATFNARGGEDQ